MLERRSSVCMRSITNRTGSTMVVFQEDEPGVMVGHLPRELTSVGAAEQPLLGLGYQLGALDRPDSHSAFHTASNE